MKYSTIEFQRGGSFKVKLFEEEASQTINAIVEKFPVEVKIMHARFGGEGIFFKCDMADVPAENQKTEDKKAGMLSLHMGSENFPTKAIHIWYGDRITSNRAENVFGEIEGDMSELKAIGERIWTEGPENAKIKIIKG